MSRALRLVLAAMCCIAIGAAAMFVVTSEQQIAQRRAAMRAFDLRAREVDGCAGRSPGGAAGLRRRRPGRRLLDAEGRPDDGRHRQLAVDASAVGHGRGVEARARRSGRHARRVQHRGQADPRLHHVWRPVDGGRHRVHRRRRGGGDGGTAGGARAHRRNVRVSMRSKRRGANRRRWRWPEPAGLLLLVIAVLALMPAQAARRVGLDARPGRVTAAMSGQRPIPPTTASRCGRSARPEPKPRQPAAVPLEVVEARRRADDQGGGATLHRARTRRRYRRS